MLIRACIVSDSPELGARLEKILRQPDLLVTRSEGSDLRSCLPTDAFDLVIAMVGAIPSPYAGTLAALAELPDRPELVALVAPGQSDERAALLCAGPEITTDDLPAAVTSGAPAVATGPEWDELLERFEREYLDRLLRDARGGIGEAARRAGVDERTLYNKMRRYGLRKESFRTGSS